MNISTVSATKVILSAISDLTPRARGIIRKRYGLGLKKPLTLEAIGKIEGITRERVRQVENDCISKIKKSANYKLLQPYFAVCKAVLDGRGGVMCEDDLLRAGEFQACRDKNSILFLMDISDDFVVRKEDVNLRRRWHIKNTPVQLFEKAVAGLVGYLKEVGRAFDEKSVLSLLSDEIKKVGLEVKSGRELEACIGLSKNIARNSWGEYGHIESPFIRPRGMRDSAYVVLSKFKEPLHFRKIAERISDFSSRKVHVQTVHNELIKDDRFVLVGRGLYALAAWGYETGFVKDVMVDILRKAPLSEREVVDEVLRRRYVKENTVVMNLRDKKVFRKLGDGRYTTLS